MVGSHGRFVWYELLTTDMEAAKAFYTQVIGWGTRDASMPRMPYALFTAGEAPVGGLMPLSEDARRMDARPSWMGYVEVNDVDATADRIKQLGGAIHLPPVNVLDRSRFSIVSDPQGATLALFKWLHPGDAKPAEPRERGHVCWHELLAADREGAWTFYSEIFGWQKAQAGVDAADTYRQFSAGGQAIGGMFTKPPTVPVPFWLYYFNVGDINAAAGRVQAAKGRILDGPSEVPAGDLIMHCVDPQGAIFALVGHNGIGYFERVPSRPPTQQNR
jgi:predicted enzyme related to lactoylglutathione lyase